MDMDMDMNIDTAVAVLEKEVKMQEFFHPESYMGLAHRVVLNELERLQANVSVPCLQCGVKAKRIAELEVNAWE